MTLTHDPRNEGQAPAVTPQTQLAHKPTHYIAMSGAHGCLPDSSNAYETYQAAVDELAELFELGRTRKARLFADRYLELRNDDGAQYCEITECQCEKPWEHCDAGEDPRDWPDYAHSPGCAIHMCSAAECTCGKLG